RLGRPSRPGRRHFWRGGPPLSKAPTITHVIPGPKSKALLAEKSAYVANAIGIHLPAVVQRAEGALLTDVDGNTFLDLSGGVGCLNVGHSHPKVDRKSTRLNSSHYQPSRMPSS